MPRNALLAGLVGLAIVLATNSANAGGWQGDNGNQLWRGFNQGLTLGPIWNRLNSRR